jgi:heterodisulfide reductase subunit C2
LASAVIGTVEGQDLIDPMTVADCYQCGKCTAGCPMAFHMDVMPNQLMRLVQLGQVERALGSEAIWRCISCQTCSARCPKSVDCAGVIDHLRQLSLEKAASSPAQQRTILFQKAFLRNIRRNGRLNELELVGSFKTSAFLDDLQIPFLFKDAALVPKMKARGKLKLNGVKVNDRDVVSRIFERCQS